MIDLKVILVYDKSTLKITFANKSETYKIKKCEQKT